MEEKAWGSKIGAFSWPEICQIQRNEILRDFQTERKNITFEFKTLKNENFKELVKIPQIST